MAKRRVRKKKENVNFSQLVRRVLDCIPKNALVDITRQRAINMVVEKNSQIEMTSSRKNVVGVLLNKYKNQTGKPKAIKGRRVIGPWLQMEAWEIALQALKNCGGNIDLAKAKLREANSCLTKLRRIEGRTAVRVRSAS
jgi:hypothetical protein